MTHPTPFPDLNDVLTQLTAGLRRVLGPDLVALYLQGSFALGDADEGSDVDFLAVTRERLTPAQAEAVQAMHRTIFDLPSPWARHLEGSYFPAELLRRPDPTHTPIPNFDHGSRDLQFSNHDNTLMVRCSAREHAIALAGPPPQELIDPVDPNELYAELWTKYEAWGQAVLDDPNSLDNDWIQPYAALSFARMLHTLDSGAVHSKRAAVEWARTHLDPHWTPLLERAWAKHSDQFLRYSEPADPVDLQLTRAFIRYALDLKWPQGAD